MDTFRRVMTLLMLVTLPPALLFWLLVHPFARSWRRLGAPLTYSLVVSVCVLVGAGIYRLRGGLLAVDYGFSWPLTSLAIVLYVAAVTIEVLRGRHLKLSILVGLPEVSKRAPGKLLTEGIYGRIRHPRYLGLMIGLTAWALFLNYLSLYLVLAASVPLLALVIFFEERELGQRFGAEYEEYRRRVPRFLPRRP